MINYKELYNKMENPLDDPKIMMKFIKAYSNLTIYTDKHFYSEYMAIEKEDRGEIERSINTKDADHFYATLFNKWKNSVCNMTKQEYQELNKKGDLGKDFIKLRQFLKKVPDVQTEQEANRYLEGKYKDKGLENAMDKYNWGAFGREQPGWKHVSSSFLNAQYEKATGAHRLYLDVEPMAMYKLMGEAVDKFEKRNIPYYFKFDQTADRIDTMVMYANDDTLETYLEVLEEIKKENPQLQNYMKNPPSLSGKIDGWIGYGSEPKAKKDGKSQSFNGIRAKIIGEVIDKKTKEWIMNHKDDEIKVNNKKMKFENYFIRKMGMKKISDLRESFINGRYKTETDKEVEKRKGYSLEDLENPNLKKAILKALSNNLDENIKIACAQNDKEVKTGRIKLRNDNHIYFDKMFFKETIYEVAPEIASRYPDFLNSIKEEIKQQSQQYGIDLNKYCFDIDKRDELFERDKINEQQNLKKIKEDKINQFEQNNVKKDTVKRTINTNNKQIGYNQVSKFLNKDLMKKMVKLPNGAQIPASQYVEEFIAPKIPQTGKFILKNGKQVTAKQYIEKFVMTKGQEKFNGDVSKMLEETTKPNNGKIIYNGQEIETSKLTKILDPKLMQGMVKLPNGAQIPTTQYIREFVAPRLPQSGKIISKNGKEVTAKQYIEKFVLVKGQEKFNGDISKMLELTTNPNTGVIDWETEKGLNEMYQDQTQISGNGKIRKENEKYEIEMQNESERKENQEQIQTQKKSNEKIKVQNVKESIKNSRITIDETAKQQSEISDRTEYKRLKFMGKNRNLNEEKRFKQLQGKYEINQQQINQQQNKENGMQR